MKTSSEAKRGASAGAPGPRMEPVSCYLCGSTARTPFLEAEDDYTGKPGTFSFATCDDCGLTYQTPRVAASEIGAYYDEEYLAHRKQTNWGALTPLYEWAMDKHDRDKERIVRRYVTLRSGSAVLDAGCAVGTFLRKLQDLYACEAVGVDFKDLSDHPALRDVEFHCGPFTEAEVGADRFDLITMWHFLEHEYEPMRCLERAREAIRPDGRLIVEVPRLDSATFRLYRDRWPGVQAPQHTILFDKARFRAFLEKAGFEIVDYLPYGAFPAYYYLFTGAAFKALKGRGLGGHIKKLMPAYFAGQLALAPLLLLERRLNLSMQTAICRRR